MCSCARVFVLRVCSPSRLHTDMHLLPCLEQRQLPLPFTASRHKPGMKHLSPQCKSIPSHFLHQEPPGHSTAPRGDSDLAGDPREGVEYNSKRGAGGRPGATQSQRSAPTLTRPGRGEGTGCTQRVILRRRGSAARARERCWRMGRDCYPWKRGEWKGKSQSPSASGQRPEPQDPNPGATGSGGGRRSVARSVPRTAPRTAPRPAVSTALSSRCRPAPAPAAPGRLPLPRGCPLQAPRYPPAPRSLRQLPAPQPAPGLTCSRRCMPRTS